MDLNNLGAGKKFIKKVLENKRPNPASRPPVPKPDDGKENTQND